MHERQKKSITFHLLPLSLPCHPYSTHNGDRRMGDLRGLRQEVVTLVSLAPSYVASAGAPRLTAGGRLISAREGVLYEEAWIRKAQSGDEQSFRRLVERHAPVIWTVINRMTLDQALAQDLFQETVIRFWKGLPSFQGSSKLSTWLYRIAYRVCLDSLNSASRKQTVSLEGQLEDVGMEPEDETVSGFKIEKDVEARDAVMLGLEKLPPEWRAMLIMFYWKGLSLEEISEITERPVNTVKVYMHRARGAMRKVLEDGGYPAGG